MDDRLAAEGSASNDSTAARSIGPELERRSPALLFPDLETTTTSIKPPTLQGQKADRLLLAKEEEIMELKRKVSGREGAI